MAEDISGTLALQSNFKVLTCRLDIIEVAMQRDHLVF